MDKQAIDVIEDYLGVPLVAPERIDPLDAKEIAAALGRLEEEAAAAREKLEDERDRPGIIDETNRERLDEVVSILEEAIANCETCQARRNNPGCARCQTFSMWLAEA